MLVLCKCFKCCRISLLNVPDTALGLETWALLLRSPEGNPSPAVCIWGLNTQIPDSVKGAAVKASFSGADHGLYKLLYVTLMLKAAMFTKFRFSDYNLQTSFNLYICLCDNYLSCLRFLEEEMKI